MTESVCDTFKTGYLNENGKYAARAFALDHPGLRAYAFSTNVAMVEQDLRHEFSSRAVSGLLNIDLDIKSFVDVFTQHWRVACALERESEKDWIKAWGAQKDVVLAVIRGFQNFLWPNFFLPVLYTTCNSLRILSIRADSVLAGTNPHKVDEQDKLKEAATVINRAFNVCIGDRAPLEVSRKWGTYFMAIQLFKCYFKLNTLNLTKNIIRAIQASAVDLPDLDAYPKSQAVTWWYYLGVVEFLEARYEQAEDYLLKAFEKCHRDAKRHSEMILWYLIPCRLVTHQLLPSRELLSRYPRLEKLFLPFNECIKSGNLKQFDEALQAGDAFFVDKRVYLTLERAREVAMRNLFRRVYMLQNATGQAKSRVPLEYFRVALEVSNGMNLGDLEVEEAECYLANMIYKGFMKGYISREHQKIVLSSKDPFPGTGVVEDS